MAFSCNKWSARFTEKQPFGVSTSTWENRRRSRTVDEGCLSKIRHRREFPSNRMPGGLPPSTRKLHDDCQIHPSDIHQEQLTYAPRPVGRTRFWIFASNCILPLEVQKLHVTHQLLPSTYAASAPQTLHPGPDLGPFESRRIRSTSAPQNSRQQQAMLEQTPSSSTSCFG